MADEKKVNVPTDEVEAAVEVDELAGDALDDDALADDEMSELFSAFADVSASDSLKESTLASILALADEAGEPDEAEPGSEAESASEPAEFKATPGGKADKTGKAGKSSKSRRRAKLRAIRIGAIAACLALALGGGVAYAMPVSHAYVTQGDTTIDLGINRFGIAVAATADDEAGRELVDSLDLRNKPYEEALARTVEALGSKGTEPVQLNVAAGDDAQRKNLEEKGNAIVAEKCPSAVPSSQENEGAAPKSEPGEPDQGDQPDQPAPGQTDQAGRSAKPEQPDDLEDDDEPAMSSGSQPSGSQPGSAQPSSGQPAQTDQPSQADSPERQSRSAESAEQAQRESSDQSEQANEPSQPDQSDQPDQDNRRGQGNQNESQSATNAEQSEQQDSEDESPDVPDPRNDRDRFARNHSASDSEEDPEEGALTSESVPDE